MKCVETIKTSFASVGAFSNERNFVLGDPEGPIDWINDEAEAFEEIEWPWGHMRLLGC